MSLAQDFEQNDDLDALSSEELEEQAFGPDPTRKRARRRQARRRAKTTLPVPEAAPAEVVPDVVHVSLMRRRTPKSKGTATLLSLGLGWMGGQRFYLGHWKLGLAMLLFSWTTIPAFLSLIDFVRFAYMSDRQFEDLYEDRRERLLVAPAPPVLPTGVVSGPRAIPSRTSS
ncbi:MAG: TM2 domain-containing protein [Bacteroidota bacterium]